MNVRSRRVLRVPLIAAALLVATGLVGPASGAGHGSDPPRVVAVGDIACQALTQGQGNGACQSGAVADLIRELDPDRFLALGDLQYNKGTLAQYLKVWDVQFGDLKDITMPTPGNHEFDTAEAAGYFTYFGDVAAPPLGFYSFDVGDWHIVSLNSVLCGDDPGCGPGSPQYEWLVDDLAANTDASCTAAFLHHPRYDWRPWQKWIVDDGTTQYGGSETEPLIPLWEAMYDAGVDVALNGDNHLYQRWAPQDAHGNVQEDGIVQFTVGTGGRQLYGFAREPLPENLEFTHNDAFGVLQLTLHDGSYDYEWVSVAGAVDVEDSGTVTCN